MMNTIEKQYHGGFKDVLLLSLKDFRAYKVRLLFYAAFFLAWAAMVLADFRMLELTVLLFVPILVHENIKQEDDNYKIENLFCSLPVNRSSIVLAKYLTALFMVIVIALLCAVSVIVFKAVAPSFYMSSGKLVPFRSVFSFLFIFALYISVSLYIYFRFGFTEHFRGLIVVLSASTALSVVLLAPLYIGASLKSGSWGVAEYLGEKNNFTGYLLAITAKITAVLGEELTCIFLGLSAVAVIVLSIKWSIKHFKNRDF